MESWRQELYLNELYHSYERSISFSNELYHHQIKGAKHGVRRFQNEDMSLTPLGRIHYGVGDPRVPSDRKHLSSAQKRNIRNDNIADKNRSRLKKENARIMSRSDAKRAAEADKLRRDVEAGVEKKERERLERAEKLKRDVEERVDEKMRRRAADEERVRKADEENEKRLKQSEERIREEIARKKAAEAADEERVRKADASIEEHWKETQRKIDEEKKRPKTNAELIEEKEREELITGHRKAKEANSDETLRRERYNAETENIKASTDRMKAENDLARERGRSKREEEADRLAAVKQTREAYEHSASNFKNAGGALSTAANYQKSALESQRNFLSNQTWTRKSEKEIAKMSNEEFQQLVNRMNLEKQYSALTANDALKGRQAATRLLYDLGTISAAASGVASTAAAFYSLKEKFEGK